MAYGWEDYSPAMLDEAILSRLLALYLVRAGCWWTAGDEDLQAGT